MGVTAIEVREGRGGKSAYIRGTRVRVSDIARLHEVLGAGGVPERIREALPHLTVRQVEAALGYWRKHEKEIRDEIDKEEGILSRLPSRV